RATRLAPEALYVRTSVALPHSGGEIRQWSSGTPLRAHGVRSFRRFQCPRANIFAVIHFFKTDQPYGFIRACDGIFQPWRPRRHAQYASAAGIENTIALTGPGV